MRASADLLQRVEERRHEVEQRLEVLRRSFEREVSWLPKGRGWLLPLVAFGCGVALAGRRKSRRVLEE